MPAVSIDDLARRIALSTNGKMELKLTDVRKILHAAAAMSLREPLAWGVGFGHYQERAKEELWLLATKARR